MYDENKGLVWQLWKEAGMLDLDLVGVLSHVCGVASMAVYLATRLIEQGVAIDPIKLERACLLHDIGKALTKPRGSSRGHVEAGVAFLQKKVVPEVIDIVQKHETYFNDEILALEELSWAERLVIMGDMLFSGNIAQLEERVEDVIRRNEDNIPPHGKIWIRESTQIIRAEILDILPSLPVFL